MTVGIFNSHDTGLAKVLGEDNWATADHYAVLATTTETPDRATQVDLEDILAECADADYSRQNLASEAVSVVSTKIRFDCGKITFAAAGSVAGRYVYILRGNVAGAANSDLIVGHVDLNTEGGNLSSVSAEFSYDPPATGLFEIVRTSAPA